jgi:hypothetical protein
MQSVAKEFRTFLLRGNLVELAVPSSSASRSATAARRCAFCTVEVAPA